MLAAHAYLIGDLVLAVVFALLFSRRHDLRKIMLYSGSLYLILGIPCFFLLKLFSSNVARTTTPGYWSPPTLFNLGQRTGGLAIEDVLFMFFASALAAGLYDFAFRVKVAKRINKKLKRAHALLIGTLAAFAVYAVTSINAMDFLIILQFAAALVIIIQRRDLAKNSLAGGLFFLTFYFGLFCLFNLLFPNFVHDYDHLRNTTHIILLGIPLEEYLYGLSFGMLFVPLYEYEHRLRDSKSKRRSSAPRKFSLAAAATRR